VFFRSNKNIIYFLILIFPLIFILFGQDLFSGLRMKIVEVNSAPMNFFLYPIKEFKKIISYRRTYDQYQALNKEVDVLKRSIQECQDMMLENSRLKDILEIKQKSIFSSVVASVVGRDPSNWFSAIIINKGSRNGLSQGMAVISPLGLVGKVAEVGENSSKVMLLTDSRFSVAAVIQKTREQGLVSGSLRGLCRMEYLDPNARVDVGDIVLTSKLSSSFPEGLIIGRVYEIRNSLSSPALECAIVPAVPMSRIEEVIVITSE
jgi:rod shape-determining protein MreC